MSKNLKLSLISLAFIPLFSSATSLAVLDDVSAKEEIVINDVKQQLAEFSVADPSLDVTYGDIDYDLASEVLTVSNMVLSSTVPNSAMSIKIDEIKGSQSPNVSVAGNETIQIREKGFLTINGFHFDAQGMLEEMANDPKQGLGAEDIKEASFFVDYFSGDDDFITANVKSNYVKAKENGMLSTSHVTVENVGDLRMSVDVAGVYSFNGKSLNDENLHMSAMGVIGINDFSLDFTTSGINTFLDYLEKSGATIDGNPIVRDDLVFKLRQLVAKAMKVDDRSSIDNYTLNFLQSILIALTNDKEVQVSMSMGNINFGSAMGLMGQSSEEAQAKYLQDVFDFELKFNAK